MIIGLQEFRTEENKVGTIVTLIIKEKLRRKDYEVFIPKIEGLMRNGSKFV